MSISKSAGGFGAFGTFRTRKAGKGSGFQTRASGSRHFPRASSCLQRATLGFLVEPHTLSNLEGRRLFVAQQEDAIVGFVTMCPIPARNGWLTEQFVRVSGAPNGTIESLLDCAATAISGDGAEFFTMGIVTLLVVGQSDTSAEPHWLSWARKWARAHYTRFYNFRGLLEFKAKFRPTRWAPVVVAVRGSNFRLGHLRSIVRAFTGIAPESALGLGILRGMRLEAELAIGAGRPSAKRRHPTRAPR